MNFPGDSIDSPGNSTSQNQLLKELTQLEEIHTQIDQAYDHYQELEYSVNRLGAVVEGHPETDYENDSEFSLYNVGRKTETDIEQDIAVMIGITSQKWRNVNQLLTDVDTELCEYQKDFEDQENILKGYEIAHENCREIARELRETEAKIEDISIETYLLLEEQPSPDSRTVLRPNSSQPIASD